MNPGRRRLLIPGLLTVLLIIVVVVAVARRAEAQTRPAPPTPSTKVSVLSDPRITESSGLAASRKYPGIAYTFNDSGHSPRVFAIDIATGKTVGVTSVRGVTWKDAEASALWGGMLWIADIGTNLQTRTDQALYGIPEPGRGNHDVRAVRYPLTFAGKAEFEAMAIVPGRIDFYSKGWPSGFVYSVKAPLKKDAQNVVFRTRRTTPAWTTDATTTANGRLVLVRGLVVVEVRDAATWDLRYSDVIPVLQQGESITMEASGRSYLIGSEGKNSPLVRIAFDPNRADAHAKPLDSNAQYKDQHPVRAIVWQHQWAWFRGGIFGLAGLIAALFAWRRVRRRRKETAHDHETTLEPDRPGLDGTGPDHVG
jgi:hypothetical protein